MKVKEKILQSKSFCPQVFQEIFSDTSGHYRVCCYSSRFKEGKYTIDDYLPFEFYNSDKMEDVRSKMMSGAPIQECENCYISEKNNKTSFRTKSIERLGENFFLTKRKLQIKVRIFSSYCNLSCYMCHPVNSTTRQKEIKSLIENEMDVPSIWKERDSSSIRFKKTYHDKFLKNILDNIDKVESIYVLGGEPLLSTYFWDFVHQIPEKESKEIILKLNTNLTKLGIKNYNVLDLKEKFKALKLIISCDHFEDKLRWIRYPIDVEEFEKNLNIIQKHDKVQFHLTVAVSILNIRELKEIREYYKKNYDNINVNFGICQKPEELSIRNLPEKIKESMIDLYKDDKSFDIVISELMRKGNSEKLKSALNYCENLSAKRNFDYKLLWKDWLKEIEINS